MEPQFLAAPKMKPFAPLSVRKTGLPDDSGCQHVFSVVAAVVKRELRESQCFKCDRFEMEFYQDLEAERADLDLFP